MATTTTTTTANDSPSSILATPLTLPVSKRPIFNRLVKAATTESLADPNTNQPNAQHCKLYSQFPGCGMILTGNVMVDRMHREASRNIVLDAFSDLSDFETWAQHIQRQPQHRQQQPHDDEKQQKQPLAIVQISHPGRQSPLAATGFSNSPVAPTSGVQARLMLPGLLGQILGRLLVLPARELQTNELPAIVQQFATCAKLAEQAGFDGVQIHAAHGYLLSQFLSPAANFRTDDYGGTAQARRKLLLQVVRAVRQATSPSFVVGVKINSKDRAKEGVERENECMDLVQALNELQLLDFIELSGGGFEDALHMRNVEQTKDDGLFYNSLAERIKQSLEETKTSYPLPPPLMLVTGGFRTKQGMEKAITNNLADAIGLGRPLCLDPNFAQDMLLGKQSKSICGPLYIVVAKDILEPALNGLWYRRQLDRLSRGLAPDRNLSFLYTLAVTFVTIYIWDWKYHWPPGSNATAKSSHAKGD